MVRAVRLMCLVVTVVFGFSATAQIVLSGGQSNVLCNGDCNGIASVSASGGAAPYTYSWSPSGGSSSIATGLCPGIYTVTVTDNLGATATRTYTITEPSALIELTVEETNVSCNQGSNGTARFEVTGGTPPYTYDWSPGTPTGDGTPIITGLAAGFYSVTATDANGCTRARNFAITQPPPLSGTTVVTSVACFGGNNGAINLTPTGGRSPYTYDWGGGVTTEDRTGLAAGTYTVVITDANSCTQTVSATVTQPASAVGGSAAISNVSCFGGSNGAIDFTPSGGATPYTYNWGGGITTQDRTGLPAGNYTVTITDANACTGTRTFTVTQPAAPVSGTTAVTNVSCFGGSNGAINLTPSGGTAPYTFSWAGGGTTEDRTGLAPGLYSVTITDANGCTGTVNATVTQPLSAVSATTVTTNIACSGGNSGAINLTPFGGTAPYTFDWGGGITTEDRTGLSAGTYSVTITDANACTSMVTTTVTQPAAPVSGTTAVTNVSCFGGGNGAINLTPTGGVGPYTYEWNGGITSEDRTGLPAGTYTVTITDAYGCTGTVNATVTQPSVIDSTAVLTYVSCFGGSDGEINLGPFGGTPPYTFNWGGGITTEDRTGLAAGDYTVEVTDANSCTSQRTFTIQQPAAPLSGTTVITNLACSGGSNGAINLTPIGGTGPYTYDWGGGITTEDRTGLAAGDYSVIITDANGCTTTVASTVTQPAAAVSGTTVITNVACFGGNNGAINLTPAGGTAPYTFDWGGGITTEDRAGLAAGSYSVVITDANGCSNTVNATVTEPAAVSSAFVVTDASCSGASDGAIDLTPGGGTAPYTFDWGGGITTEDRTGLAAGTYTVVITDASGCTVAPSYTVDAPAALEANGSVTPATVAGACDGTATVAPAGGTAPYSIIWSTGSETTSTITGLCEGSITATITDANGCTVTWTGTIESPDADLAVTITGPAGPIEAGGTIAYTIVATTTGGAPNTTIAGMVPTGTAFVSLVAPAGWSCILPPIGTSGAWSCSIPLLPASSSATFTLAIGVPVSHGAGTVNAAVDVTADVADPVITNNSATTGTAILAAGMATIPTLDARAILLLAALLGAAAFLRIRA